MKRLVKNNLLIFDLFIIKKMDKTQNRIVPVSISQMPDTINISEIDIIENQCFDNSYNVAKKNLDVELVEGIIIIYDYANGEKHYHIFGTNSTKSNLM